MEPADYFGLGYVPIAVGTSCSANERLILLPRAVPARRDLGAVLALGYIVMPLQGRRLGKPSLRLIQQTNSATLAPA